jgi:ribonuclease BN (tRNA processing enzyme)
MINTTNKIIILGSGVCVPSKRRNSPGYYLQFNNEHFLIDSGSGTLHALATNDIDYTNLDGIFYTHFHIDHIGDMEPILFAFRYNPLLKREKPLKLYGPTGLKSLIDNYFNKVGEEAKPTGFPIEIIEVKDGDKIKLETGCVKIKHVKHSKESVGYRFEDKENKIITFSGDTGKCQSLIDLAKNADLAIFEASMPEEVTELLQNNNKMDSFSKYIDTHLTPSLAGKLAKQACVKKLVLSHIYPATDNFPILDRCKKYFGENVVLAEDCIVFNL